MAKTSRKGGRSDSAVVLSSAQNDRRAILQVKRFEVPVYNGTMAKGVGVSAKDAEDKVLHQSREIRQDLSEFHRALKDKIRQFKNGMAKDCPQKDVGPIISQATKFSQDVTAQVKDLLKVIQEAEEMKANDNSEKALAGNDDHIPSVMDLVGFGHRLEQEVHFSFAEAVTSYQNVMEADMELSRLDLSPRH